MGGVVATIQKRAKIGRKRRVAGWSLLVIGVLITGVWGASRWCWFGYTTPDWWLSFGEGHMSILTHPTPIAWRSEGWNFECGIPDTALTWLFSGDFRYSSTAVSQSNFGLFRCARVFGMFEFNVRLWPIALASLFGGAWLLWSGRRARRRAMTGVCLKCGYDLAGLAAGAPCPECGKGAAAA